METSVQEKLRKQKAQRCARENIILILSSRSLFYVSGPNLAKDLETHTFFIRIIFDFA